MSISDIAMLVNDNFNKPLNAQMRDLAYNGSYLITSSIDFSPDKSGLYKVICVGRGGDSDSGGYTSSYHGGAGGVAIKTMHLNSSETYPIVVASNKSSFNDTIIANCGGNGFHDSSGYYKYGEGGTAVGGDFNYTGTSGEVVPDGKGADVGVFIPGLMQAPEMVIVKFSSTSSSNSSYIIRSGYGILGYGGGQGQKGLDSGISEGGCVLIIPLELEE